LAEPVELRGDDLLSERPSPQEELDLSVDVDVVVPPPSRQPSFSDVTPMWSSLDVTKLASPLFAAQPEKRSWRDALARIGSAAGRHRTRIAGVAIATVGALATCILVSFVHGSKSEDARAAMVAPLSPEPRNDPSEATAPPAVAPPPSDAPTASDPSPLEPAASRPLRKGSPRDKTPAHADATPSRPPPPTRTAPATPPAVTAAAPAPAPRAEPAPSPTPATAGGEAMEEFNRTAAMEAMRHAGDTSRACGAAGGARVAVTFVRSGGVSDVGIEGPLSGTPSGNCIVGKFRALRIPPFRGSSVTVRRTLSF
jgi:hypothetical protein